MYQPEILIQQNYLLGEGPVWDAANNCIYWVDILPGNIHRYSIDTKQHETFNAGQMVGAVVLRASGGLVAAMQQGFYFVDFDDKIMQPVINPETHLPGNRFNDGKCDAAGRFWAGTMPLTEDEAAGSLYMLDVDLSAALKVPGVTISNGLAWNAGNTIMYYIDTPTREIAAYDFDIHTGNITNKRVAIDVHDEEGWPDGMTIDTDGMLWVAYYGGWQVVQYNPYTGEALQRIQFPASNITCCTFGGPQLNDLYVTSASKQLTIDEMKKQPDAGCLFIVKNVGATGFLPEAFAG